MTPGCSGWTGVYEPSEGRATDESLHEGEGGGNGLERSRGSETSIRPQGETRPVTPSSRHTPPRDLLGYSTGLDPNRPTFDPYPKRFDGLNS